MEKEIPHYLEDSRLFSGIANAAREPVVTTWSRDAQYAFGIDGKTS